MLPKWPTARQGKARSNWASPQAPQWTSWSDYRCQYYMNTWKNVINHIRVVKGTLAQAHLDHLQGQVNEDEETWNDPIEEDNHQFSAAQQAALQQVVHSATANVSKTTSLSLSDPSTRSRSMRQTKKKSQHTRTSTSSSSSSSSSSNSWSTRTSNH